MKKLVLGVFVVLAVMSALPPAQAVDYVVSTFASTEGTRYAISSGTSTGSCTSISDGKQCVDGSSHSTSVTNATACGNTLGQAFCVIIPADWTPPLIAPLGTTTLECTGQGQKSYELTDGGAGECTLTNNKTATGSGGCAAAGTSNYANATCTGGCGAVNGTGKCQLKG